MKKVLISISMIVLLVVMSCSTAFADTTEPVEAGSGEHKTEPGNVTVSGEEQAAVSVVAFREDASATVAGDVSLNSTSDDAVGVRTFGAQKEAVATVNGSLAVNGENEANGVGITAGGTVTVGKDVTVAAPNATGANFYESFYESILKVGGDLSVASTASDREGSAVGLMIKNYIGTIQIDIGGDLLVKGNSERTAGIYNRSFIVEPSTSAPFVSAIIHGSVVSDGYGIISTVSGLTDIVIENELKAKETGVILVDMPAIDDVPVQGTSAENLKLTVWKIQLNSQGHIADYYSYSALGGDQGLDDVNRPASDRKVADDFENSIMYIIKCEQPTKGGKISAVDANGNPLAKSFGFDVAHEGNRIYLKTALKKGYKLVAAYNGEGEKIALRKDAKGYYYEVPKGGGVYLSVKLQKVKKKTTPAPVYYGGSTADVQGVKTGDSAQTNLWYLLLFASIICFGVVKIRVRREEA